MKISIRGVACSGKTTLAKRLSKEFNIPHIELDELYWLPGWKERELNELLSKVEKKISQDSWVIDGNYSKVYKNLDVSPDYLIYLDYSLLKILIRCCKRSFNRIYTQKKVCNGNIEKLSSVFSSDSIFVWILKTYKLRKREIKDLEKSCYNNLVIIRKDRDIVEMIKMLKTSSF